MKLLMFFTTLLLSSKGVECQEINPKYYTFALTGEYGKFGANYDVPNSGFSVTVHKDSIGILRRIEEVTGYRFTKKTISEDSEYLGLKIKLRRKEKWRMSDFYSFTKLRYNSLIGFQWWKGEFKKESMINASKNEKESFLAGLFLKYGGFHSDTFSYKLIEDSVKYYLSKELIVEFGATIIQEKVELDVPLFEYYGPCFDHYFIEFIPNEGLRELLEIEIKRKETFANTTYR